MNTHTIDRFNAFSARLLEFIPRSIEFPQSLAGAFNELALELFRLQFENVPAYRTICEARKVSSEAVDDWKKIPAVPTAAFKELELTSLAPSERTSVFYSSGTTGQIPSRHSHNAESLAIYEASLLAWFQAHFDIGPGGRQKMAFLSPPHSSAPHSSLVYMFETLRRNLGSDDSAFAGTLDADGAWTLDIDRTIEVLRQSAARTVPLILLGTAFSFVHLVDGLAANDVSLKLPRGSRVMETGGYKGRSREVPKSELHNLIAQTFGVPAESIVTEYGMSELSSQAYARRDQGPRFKVQSSASGDCRSRHEETPISRKERDTAQERGGDGNFRFPPWARVQIVSPETGREVAEGESGLIRVFDLANVRSVMAIQTEDLGIRRGDGFELLGRARLSEPRGCSLMAS